MSQTTTSHASPSGRPPAPWWQTVPGKLLAVALAAVVAVALVLAGVALGRQSATPVEQATHTVPSVQTVTETPEQTGPPGFNPTSLEELHERAQLAGMRCDGWYTKNENSGTCGVSNVQMRWVDLNHDGLRNIFMSYVATEFHGITDQETGDPNKVMLLGGNWYILMHKDDARVIQDRLGGAILGRVI